MAPTWMDGAAGFPLDKTASTTEDVAARRCVSVELVSCKETRLRKREAAALARGGCGCSTNGGDSSASCQQMADRASLAPRRPGIFMTCESRSD